MQSDMAISGRTAELRRRSVSQGARVRYSVWVKQRDACTCRSGLVSKLSGCTQASKWLARFGSKGFGWLSPDSDK